MSRPVVLEAANPNEEDPYTLADPRAVSSTKPLVRLGHKVFPKDKRPVTLPGAQRRVQQRPSDATLVASMTRPDCPRRFVPPSSETQPKDLFRERVDFSMNKFPRYIPIGAIDGSGTFAASPQRRQIRHGSGINVVSLS